MQQQPQQHSAAYRLFKYPFRISIPAGFISSVEENRALGAYTSGNTRLDRAAAAELTSITVTIAKMVELYKRSITIRFEGTADCVRIYDIILEHINDFKNYIESSSYVSRPIPFDDLRDLDEFAGHVYLMARGRIAERTATSVAINALESEVTALIQRGNAKEVTHEEVFQGVAQTVHIPSVDKLERTFQARHKAWR